MAAGVHTEVHPGATEPVFRKVATGEAGRATLAAEAARLERASHPGVVMVVDQAEDHLDLRWAGGHTLATSRPEASAVAGTLASVAATVADLHRLGIVHGRLRADHVVIDGDGRARLCSIRPPAPGEPEPTPADDVLAIGQLLAEAAGAETEIEPIPDRRWRRTRWSGYHRRALLTLADQATDPDPAVRPTARALAAALADLTPTRQVPPPTAEETDRGPEAVRRRWRAAFGRPGPEDAEALAHPDASVPDDADSETRPPVETVDAEAPSSDETPHLTEARAAEPALGSDTDADAAPSDNQSEPESGAESETKVRIPRTMLGPLGLRLAGPEAPAAPARPRRLGARPAAASLDRPLEPAGRRGLIVVAAAAAIVVAVLVSTGQRSAPPPSADRAGATTVDIRAEPVPTTGSPKGPPERSEPKDCPPVDGPAADVDGDGCPEPITVAGRQVEAGEWTWEAGVEGDMVTVGDWDCNGTATIGLVRPATGEIFLFDRWASNSGVETEVRATVLGAQALVPTTDPCTTPRVLRADGTFSAVPAA